MLREDNFRLTNTSDGGENGWTDAAREVAVAAIRNKPRSEETKRKISEAHKGRIVSDETKEKIRAARVRQVICHSDETKEKIRQSLIGSSKSEESRKKMSETKRINKERIEMAQRAVLRATPQGEFQW